MAKSKKTKKLTYIEHIKKIYKPEFGIGTGIRLKEYLEKKGHTHLLELLQNPK